MKSIWNGAVIWLAGWILGAALLLNGCATIHGAGTDIKSAGEAIQKAAE
ncbi:MAG TPA: entericidin A/B family lipoprotein [bacterium]|nr:entericidin A/B family lipoprotein [bacterium]